MKALLNWRYYVMAVLFTAALLLVLFAFGKDDLPIEVSMPLHFGLFGAGIGLFCILGRCVSRWEASGKIPEYTNYKET